MIAQRRVAHEFGRRRNLQRERRPVDQGAAQQRGPGHLSDGHGPVRADQRRDVDRRVANRGAELRVPLRRGSP